MYTKIQIMIPCPVITFHAYLDIINILRRLALLLLPQHGIRAALLALDASVIITVTKP
jgi:hypothetical protein